MTILVIAPHADDEVLGMGGTIARLSNEGKRVVVAVATGHGEAPHPLWDREVWDVVRSECRRAAGILGVAEVLFRELPAACLDSTPAWQTNQVIAELIGEVAPSEVYVPFPFDLHRDHEAIAYAVSVATRPYLKSAGSIERVLAYETLTETHLAPPYLTPAFQPNVYVDISATLDTKLEAFCAYESQIQDDSLPRSIAALRALATLRGTHIGCAAAEAFVLLGDYRR
jgi:LmbE family N-acetylglucosaminyl deacetylase